ncbi:hypothetical protein BWD12_04400 [Leptospira santarosai serovar Bananal]|nr:hypothetical protein BWD11_08675 [Leptospira santarosai serovar Grippotyphosa]ONF80603.1 hypothetical protein BWD12_04400 [Leptospira santarosai serovar Bananal]ONF87461.1 hypothetical protein BWD13_06830 [Leptospira santarosai serovar Grippotyphosa]
MRKYSKDKKTVFIQYFCYMKFLVYKQAISERLTRSISKIPHSKVDWTKIQTESKHSFTNIQI